MRELLRCGLIGILATEALDAACRIHQALLAGEERVEYSAETLKETTAKQIIDQAERFAAWAEEAGARLQIEGW